MKKEIKKTVDELLTTGKSEYVEDNNQGEKTTLSFEETKKGFLVTAVYYSCGMVMNAESKEYDCCCIKETEEKVDQAFFWMKLGQ